MANSKSVVLWGREDVLANAVELFLASRKDWEVVRISDEAPVETLFWEVDRINPRIVILYHGDSDKESYIPFQLMNHRPDIKIITVSLENNRLEVYDRHSVCVQEKSDLLSLLEG